jgi:preprotein translocase subunit YajC
MAKKKSSKSSRHQRAKKQESAKKKPTVKKVATAAVIAEGSDEPVVKTEKVAAKKTAPKKKADGPIEAAIEAEADKLAHESAKELMQPARNRMLLSAVALGVIIIALVFGAAIIRQQNTDKQAEQMVKSGQVSGKADEILQSGGNVCTNGKSQTDTTGSANPDSVGMMLQSNPTNEIQTPQTIGGGNDANTLQGASCF